MVHLPSRTCHGGASTRLCRVPELSLLAVFAHRRVEHWTILKQAYSQDNASELGNRPR